MSMDISRGDDYNLRGKNLNKTMIYKNTALILSIPLIVLSLTSCTTENKPTPITPVITLDTLTSRQLVDQCTTDMATEFHIHAHLTIIANKKPLEVPANVGIDLVNDCMSSLHTHDNTGIIHVEAPIQKDFTLSDFFYKWNKPLSDTQFMDLPIDAQHGLKVYVDGIEVAEPQNIIFKDQQNIVMDYYLLSAGPDKLPAPYSWSEEEKD